MLSSYDKYENEIMLKQKSTNVHTNHEPFIGKKNEAKIPAIPLKKQQNYYFYSLGIQLISIEKRKNIINFVTTASIVTVRSLLSNSRNTYQVRSGRHR
jgi:hypothetical protein